MSGLFFIFLLILGSVFSFNIYAKKIPVETTRKIEENRVIEDDDSYIDNTISSYFDMDDEN